MGPLETIVLSKPKKKKRRALFSESDKKNNAKRT
jgi:hypothetical protein